MNSMRTAYRLSGRFFKNVFGYLNAVKISVTMEKVFLAKRLREIGLRFQWKIYKEDSWLDLLFGEKGIIVSFLSIVSSLYLNRKSKTNVTVPCMQNTQSV